MESGNSIGRFNHWFQLRYILHPYLKTIQINTECITSFGRHNFTIAKYNNINVHKCIFILHVNRQ